jgi:5-formyltetrahydrofolate cyclo-ligase
MKQTLKAEIYEKRNALSDEEIKEKSDKIKNNLLSLDEFKNSKNIMFYVSFNKEVDTHKLIKDLLNEKDKTVLVPYTVKNDLRLNVSELKDFNELELNDFGILEPKEPYIREFNPDKIDIVIVPGMVFDKTGHRIGYGYGYYDRFLKAIKNILKIGLAYDLQLVEKIQEEEHDVPMDIIVTDKEIIKMSKI